MKRRDLLWFGALGLLAPAATRVLAQESKPAGGKATPAIPSALKLTPPAKDSLSVMVVLSSRAQVIDFAGPWEVFNDVHIPERGPSPEEQYPFRLSVVAETLDLIRCTGGLFVKPGHTFESAPQPRVIIIPAQEAKSPALLDWVRRATEKADVTLSVCTGAFVLARAGLLDGREATTHHDALNDLERQFPRVKVKRGVRFVEGAKISTAAGLTSGIDLSLRVVERYFGRQAAENTARFMEYQSTAWQV